MTYQIYQAEGDDEEYYFVNSSNTIFKISIYEIEESNYFPIKWFDISPINSDFTPLDKNIAFTVIDFLKRYIENNDCAIVFTCDTSDGRELARFRKFDSWYQKHNDGTFLKHDKVVIGKSTQKRHYTSVILKDNKTSFDTIELYENWLDNFSK